MDDIYDTSNLVDGNHSSGPNSSGDSICADKIMRLSQQAAMRLDTTRRPAAPSPYLSSAARSIDGTTSYEAPATDVANHGSATTDGAPAGNAWCICWQGAIDTTRRRW